MNPKLLHILQHSIGVDQYGQGHPYRNHFVTGPECDNWQLCQELVAMGLMTCRKGPKFIPEQDRVFSVTPKGELAIREFSPKPPRLNRAQQRYRDFLRADSGMKFGEWLKWAHKNRGEIYVDY